VKEKLEEELKKKMGRKRKKIYLKGSTNFQINLSTS
jgi:hypothetical protein